VLKTNRVEYPHGRREDWVNAVLFDWAVVEPLVKSSHSLPIGLAAIASAAMYVLADEQQTDACKDQNELADLQVPVRWPLTIRPAKASSHQRYSHKKVSEGGPFI